MINTTKPLVTSWSYDDRLKLATDLLGYRQRRSLGPELDDLARAWHLHEPSDSIAAVVVLALRVA